MTGLVQISSRQGPDHRPLWLLVGTPSAIKPELASTRRSLACPIPMSLYIFLINNIDYLFCTYRFVWHLRFGWLLVCCLYKEVYLQIFRCVSFWFHGCCGEWEGWAHKPVNHARWVAVVTPTDRPKSVRNRCVIELFVTLFVLWLCPFDIPAGEGAFVIGLSQISSLFS